MTPMAKTERGCSEVSTSEPVKRLKQAGPRRMPASMFPVTPGRRTRCASHPPKSPATKSTLRTSGGGIPSKKGLPATCATSSMRSLCSTPPVSCGRRVSFRERRGGGCSCACPMAVRLTSTRPVQRFFHVSHGLRKSVACFPRERESPAASLTLGDREAVGRGSGV